METNKQTQIDEWEEMQTKGGLWYPEEENEELTGVVIETPEMRDRYVLKDKEDYEWFLPNHTVLYGLLAEVNNGDVIRILYKGEKPSAAGKKATKIYKVYRKNTTL